MKIFVPVLAGLAAATLSLNAQTQTTTPQTTATTHGATVTTPTTSVATPSTSVATPQATATAPSATISEPAGAAVTTPSASVVAPSTTVTTPSTTVATPSTTVTTPSATVDTSATVSTPSATVAAPPSTPPPGHPIAGYVAQEDKWIEAPSSLPNAQMMVLHGDINKAGPYTIRLRFPAGYQVPLHWQDNEVNFTVITGALHIGIAPRYDASNSKEIGAMSFATIPARMKHTLWTDVETIVQVHGLGPWNMHEVYPAATVRVTP